MTITLRVQNGASARDLFLRGRDPTFDVVLTNSRGEVVWRRLEKEIIPAIVNVRILAPREQFELTATWDQKDMNGEQIATGEYTARGMLLVEGEPLATRAVKLLIAV